MANARVERGRAATKQLIDEQLRLAILGSDLKVGTIARKAEVDPKSLALFVRGERTMTLAVAARVCDALEYHLVGFGRRKR